MNPMLRSTRSALQRPEVLTCDHKFCFHRCLRLSALLVILFFECSTLRNLGPGKGNMSEYQSVEVGNLLEGPREVPKADTF